MRGIFMNDWDLHNSASFQGAFARRMDILKTSALTIMNFNFSMFIHMSVTTNGGALFFVKEG